jgi:hypothetical protein
MTSRGKRRIDADVKTVKRDFQRFDGSLPEGLSLDNLPHSIQVQHSAQNDLSSGIVFFF